MINNLFLLYSKDLAYFDGLKEVILAVGLIVPKLGVFHEHIRYLLCLTTPTEVVILGVSFNGTLIIMFGFIESGLIHIDVLMLCRKFELIPTKTF